MLPFLLVYTSISHFSASVIFVLLDPCFTPSTTTTTNSVHQRYILFSSLFSLIKVDSFYDSIFNIFNTKHARIIVWGILRIPSPDQPHTLQRGYEGSMGRGQRGAASQRSTPQSKQTGCACAPWHVLCSDGSGVWYVWGDTTKFCSPSSSSSPFQLQTSTGLSAPHVADIFAISPVLCLPQAFRFKRAFL